MQKRKGFSLAEMLMVLLVVSVVLGASLPTFTKKSNVSKSGIPCRYAANGSDFYCADGNNQSAIIGANQTNIPNAPGSTATGNPNEVRSKFIINMPNAWAINNHSHIIFQRNNNTVGRLVFGDDNIGLGNRTLMRITPGTPDALGNPTRGIRNIALGTDALRNASTGEGNTALGFGTLLTNDHGTSNTAVGRDALRELSGNNANVVQILTGDAGTSSGNTAVGSRALETNTTGGSNTALGSQALQNNNSGSFNVAIGHNACRNGNASAPGPSNAICIGKNSNVTGDNSIAIGGTAHPSNAGATAGANQIVLGTAGQTVIIRGNLVVENGSNVANAIVATRGDISSSNNSAGAGGAISLRTHTHSISGTTNSGGSGGPCDHSHGFNVTTTGVSSDIRLKNMKGNNNDGLGKVRKLAVWNYSYKSDKKNTPHVGVVAQELMKVFPNAVTKGADGYYLIRTEDIQYAMLNAIKELDSMVQKISERIKTVSDKITAITKTEQAAQKRIQALEAKNKELVEKNNALIAQSKAFEARLKKLEQK